MNALNWGSFQEHFSTESFSCKILHCKNDLHVAGWKMRINVVIVLPFLSLLSSKLIRHACSHVYSGLLEMENSIFSQAVYFLPTDEGNDLS